MPDAYIQLRETALGGIRVIVKTVDTPVLSNKLITKVEGIGKSGRNDIWKVVLEAEKNIRETADPALAKLITAAKKNGASTDEIRRALGLAPLKYRDRGNERLG